jgi:hypothetical protein
MIRVFPPTEMLSMFLAQALSARTAKALPKSRISSCEQGLRRYGIKEAHALSKVLDTVSATYLLCLDDAGVLTDEEKALLERFRQAHERGRAIVIAVAEAEGGRHRWFGGWRLCLRYSWRSPGTPTNQELSRPSSAAPIRFLQRLFSRRAYVVDHPTNPCLEKVLGEFLSLGDLPRLFNAAPLLIFNAVIDRNLSGIPKLVNIRALKAIALGTLLPCHPRHEVGHFRAHSSPISRRNISFTETQNATHPCACQPTSSLQRLAGKVPVTRRY